MIYSLSVRMIREIVVNGQKIKSVEEFKYLGVTTSVSKFQSFLSFKCHIKKFK